MGDDDLNASIAHIVLCCVAGEGLGRSSARSFTHPGMHANFFVHGILGFLNYQSNLKSIKIIIFTYSIISKGCRTSVGQENRAQNLSCKWF